MEHPAYMRIRDDKPGVVEVDPDQYYPAFLEEIGQMGDFAIEVQREPKGPSEKVTLRYDGEPDQYWLEVAHTLMKLDCSFWCGLLKRRLIERRVVGQPGYKDRWGQRDKPKGRIAELEERWGKRPEPGTGMAAVAPVDSQVRREAREIYRKLRGVLPSMA